MGHYQHETACVDEGAEIGEGTHIWHFVHVSSGARIGRDCVLGQNVYIAPTAVIGDRVRIQNNVSLYDGVLVEDDAFIGPSAVFTNVINPRAEIPRRHELQTTRIERGATVGANATILCGHTLGRYAFLGAGSVLTADVPPFALVYGNPARQAGWICRCGAKLDVGASAWCGACGQAYRLVGTLLVEA